LAGSYLRGLVRRKFPASISYSMFVAVIGAIVVLLTYHAVVRSRIA
jgi:uncharacterized membrane protein YeaQ/YmgE (transglycosylase-associated protein family)